MSEAKHDIAVKEIPNLLKKLIDSSQSQASSENVIPSGSHSHVVNDPPRAKTKDRGRQKRIESSIEKIKKRSYSSRGYNPSTCAAHAPSVAWATYVEYPAHRPTNAVHASDAADAFPTGDASDVADASPTGDASDAADASPAGDDSPAGDASDVINVAPTAMAVEVQFHSGGLSGVHSC
ncbi:hypothetical protein Taro_050964 [Colocasia esculenta]|uniref:Uncharacterized protein n=1 Tax=Colocasia esculenta TaxID=4460 RepID=A0A843XFI1_COLES|nr:hypothetical protein [Colocasia esculenta]